MIQRAVAAAPDLDRRILDAVNAWSRGATGLDDAAFDALALDLYAYQRATNEAYGRYALTFAQPRSWREVPAVPAAAFKDATLATFDVRDAALEFHTSGTTGSRPGRHFFARADFYDAALLAGFDRFMLPDGARLAYRILAPDPRDSPRSSLGYMLEGIGRRRGVDAPRFYMHDGIEVQALCADLRGAERSATPVCIAGTAFALVALLDALEASATTLSCPAGSRIMETGGFKGRTRVVDRAELYAALTARLGIPPERIVAEYGMTELTSQYYDAVPSRTRSVRVKAGPPWLRTLVVDADGTPVRRGEVGFLRHVDLGNRSSVIAVQTEDRGYEADGGFVLLGRDLDAPLRGCSLDAEELAARR